MYRFGFETKVWGLIITVHIVIVMKVVIATAIPVCNILKHRLGVIVGIRTFQRMYRRSWMRRQFSLLRLWREIKRQPTIAHKIAGTG